MTQLDTYLNGHSCQSKIWGIFPKSEKFLRGFKEIYMKQRENTDSKEIRIHSLNKINLD